MDRGLAFRPSMRSRIALSDCPGSSISSECTPISVAARRLVAHVNARRRIVAGKHDGEPRLHSALHKRVDPLFERRADRAASDFPSRIWAAMGARSLALGPSSRLSLPRPRSSTDATIMSAVPQFPAANDPDALETQEWLDALEAVLEREGPSARTICSSG